MGDQELITSLSDLDDLALLETIVGAIGERPEVVQSLSDWMFAGDGHQAYASAKMFNTQRLDGVVKSFREETGYGFISCEGGKDAFGCDVFVHGAQLHGAPIGAQVSFVIFLNKDQKPQAFDVRIGGSKGSEKVKVSGKGKAGKTSYAAPAAHVTWDPWAEAGFWDGKGKANGAWDAGFWAGVGNAKGAAGKDQKGGAKTPRETPESTADVPGVTDERFDGSFKSFNGKTGFGFIECEAIKELYGNDVFVHKAQVAELTPIPGMAVNFAVFLNKDGKPQAKDLVTDADPPAKRARQS